MSIESLRRVLLKIKGEAHEMRKQKHAKRLAPKPKEPVEKGEKGGDTVGKIRELLSKE